LQGLYSVSVDGQATIADGFADGDSPADFQACLFSVNDLKPGTHQVVVTDISTDAGRPYWDLDYGVIVGGDGNPKCVYCF
jgi:hypothetical protein